MVLIDIFVYLKSTSHYIVNETITHYFCAWNIKLFHAQ